MPDPTGNQVLVKMEAAPINPSDLFILTGAADLENADYSNGKYVAHIPEPYITSAKARHGAKLPAGNEGAGTVVAVGDSDRAKALIGQRVSCVSGSAYSQYCSVDAARCMPLGDHSFEDGASTYVNPMTALGFVETVKALGEDAIVHTVGASNVGQMLNRICQEDGIGLVNIVRKQSHVELLRTLEIEHVVNSSDHDFLDQLDKAIDDTGTFCGFDPIGGGPMADTVMKAMERVAASRMGSFSRYGSSQAIRMYIYGRLDPRPPELSLGYGSDWAISSWFLTGFLDRAGTETAIRMRKRVLDNLTTTFASTYKRRVNLEEMLTREVVLDYRALKTGEKYLVTPWS